ncbi:MAG: fibronectin type III domain-containing protein [Treponema sp.]|nr:fibronectin type III domain-containing protein [Treponema sp.]
MKRFHILLLGAAFSTAAMFFTSCKDNFLSAPSPISVSDSSRAGAPDGLTASNGKSGCIELSWQSVNGASRYYIYGTDNPTPKESDFQQIEQTKETSISIKVSPGSTSWYKVAAVDSTYNVGKKSLAVRGSSLARPEITQIESDESSDEIAVNVYWYMTNCLDDTYRSDTTYEIKYTDPSNKSESVFIKASDIEENLCTISNLRPHTTYSYQVIARNDIYGDSEESTALTEETLYRLRPSAPIELTAEKGGSKSSITLTFKLPEMAYVFHNDGTYKQLPLYFKIYRRKAGTETWPTTEKGTRTVTDYEEGKEISWTDTDILPSDRGVKFEYKVQSFVDTSKLNEIMNFFDDHDAKNYTYIETSVNACATDEGWAMAKPSLSVRDYAPVDDGAENYSYATTGFTFIWNNFISNIDEENNALALKYHYHLYKKLTKFAVDGGAESTDYVRTFSSISDVNDYVHEFNLPEDRGNYIFTLYISDSSTPSDSGLETVAMEQKLIVTDTKGEIEGLDIKGGYKDKFEISWNYDSSCTYTLTYTQKCNGIDDGQTYAVSIPTQSGGKITIPNDSIPEEKQEYGVTRVYTLSAAQIGGTAAPISQTYEPVESLGKPHVEFDENNPSYDSISVSWKKVSGAERYAIKIDGQSTDTEINMSDGDDSNVSVSTVAGETVYTYTFKPNDIGANYYKDATKSGTDRTVTITAYSDKEDTQGSGNARTLGPAKVGLTAEVAQKEDSIDITWNSIDGAAGYYVQRWRYKIKKGNDYSEEDKDSDFPELFYVDASTSIPVVANPAMSVTKSDGKFKLTDAFSENDGASQTQKMIPWGIPIEYTVIPVLNSKDKYSGGKLTSDSIENTHNFTYTNTDSDSIAKMGSTIGYGLNLRATKAEFSNKIELEWDEPYGRTSDATPIVYRKPAGSSDYMKDNPRNENIALDSENKATFTCTTGAELIDAHEFAVKYVKGSTGSDSPFVASFTEELLTDLEGNSTEQRNKGYAFALGRFNDYNDVVGLTASKNDSFTEIVSWPSWDYAKKKNGPEDIYGKHAYTIWQKNLNNASGWFMIGSMDAAGNITITNPDWYETEITKSFNQLNLKAKNVDDSSGCSNGLLKVQRDYKHYYIIRAQRKVGDTTIYTYLGLDDSVFGYRKISAEEFSKCITLILADAINQSGIDSDGNRSVGNFRIKHNGASKTIIYGTPDGPYKHDFHDIPGKRKETMSSGFTIQFPDTESRSALNYSKAYYFPTATISVSHESGLNSYGGTLKFTAGEKGHEGLTVLSDGVTTSWIVSAVANLNSGLTNATTAVTSSNEEEFKKIFPFGLGQDHKDGFTTYNKDYPTYQNEWWNPRYPKGSDGNPIETDTYKEKDSFKEKEGE